MRDLSLIDNRLIKWKRYNFTDKNGTTKRRTVGMTTWTKPVMLLLYNARATWSSDVLEKDNIVSIDWENVICNCYLF